MALLPETNSLKDLLTKHALPNVYDSLLSQGYSMELLSECSENDVEELCGVLKLDLIHRLRFKRCLKELNIPKSSNYTIITQKEQKVIHDIDHTLQTLQKRISTSASDAPSTLHDPTIEQNKQLINRTWDALINNINRQRKETLMKLDATYKCKQQQNKLITACYNELQQIKCKCESLLIPSDRPNIDFNQRCETMLDMKRQWNIKYQTLSEITKIDININDQLCIMQNIANLIQIRPQKVSVMDDDSGKSVLGKRLRRDRDQKQSSVELHEEKEMDIRPQNNQPITDTIDTVHDSLLFQHRPLRAWRFDAEQQKWRGRGKGQLSIYHNDQTQSSKLIFLDEKHDKTRLLQPIDGATHAHTSTSEDNLTEIRWNAADYTMDAESPLIGEWKIQFMEANLGAANQFTDVFNQYAQEPIKGPNPDTFEMIPQNDESSTFSWNHPKGYFTSSISIAQPFIPDGAIDEAGRAAFCAMFKQQTEGQWCCDSCSTYNPDTTNLCQSCEVRTNVYIPKRVVVPSTDDSNNNNDVVAVTKVEEGLKPIIDLKEQTVPSGHENETLLQSIEFRRLYVFGQDAMKEWCWKERATQSTIGFYKCKENGMIRMVVREQATNKLRLNHYVPSEEAFAKLQQKRSDTAYSWNANDETLEKAISVFCIRFGDTNNAQLFHQQFLASMGSNDRTRHGGKGELVIEEGIVEESGVIPIHNDENNDRFSFSFGANGVSHEDKEDRKGDDCPICYENPQLHNAQVTQCGHVFCEECIKKSLQGTQQCPMCRKECFVDDLKEMVVEVPTAAEAPQDGAIQSFVDTEQFNFGAFMQDIKGFVTTTIEDEEDHKESSYDIEENVSKITFKPIANLSETEVQTGHENETCLKSFEIRKLYRWGRDVADQPCWKCRASNTLLQFYQDDESGKIRLVSREHCTNKLRLNQWIAPLEIAHLKKKSAQQVQWEAYDATLWIEGEDGVNNGFAIFAAKFRDVESANGFFEMFESMAQSNQAANDDTKDNSQVNAEEDAKDELEIDETHVKLNEYGITRLSIWDGENWKPRALNTKVGIYQAKRDGMMDLMCRERTDHTNRLRLNHSIPPLEIASLEHKSDTELQWSTLLDETVAKEQEVRNESAVDNSCMFMATFEDSETADKFLGFFQAGSMNNALIINNMG